VAERAEGRLVLPVRVRAAARRQGRRPALPVRRQEEITLAAQPLEQTAPGTRPEMAKSTLTQAVQP